jgi:hypothetical protein
LLQYRGYRPTDTILLQYRGYRSADVVFTWY